MKKIKNPPASPLRVIDLLQRGRFFIFPSLKKRGEGRF